MRFANDFHSWLRHPWKLLANRLTRDPKIVIHGNSCIILYISSALAMDLLRSCTEPLICSFKKNCITVIMCYSIGYSCRDNWVNSFLLASLSHFVGVNKPMLLSMWKTSPWQKYPFQMECMFQVINKFSLGGSYALLLLIHCVLSCL